jgi:hypothetical protein
MAELTAINPDSKASAERRLNYVDACERMGRLRHHFAVPSLSFAIRRSTLRERWRFSGPCKGSRDVQMLAPYYRTAPTRGFSDVIPR